MLPHLTAPLTLFATVRDRPAEGRGRGRGRGRGQRLPLEAWTVTDALPHPVNDISAEDSRPVRRVLASPARHHPHARQPIGKLIRFRCGVLCSILADAVSWSVDCSCAEF